MRKDENTKSPLDIKEASSKKVCHHEKRKKKAGSILPGASLAVAYQSFCELGITPKKISNFGIIKSLKEDSPDKWSDGQIPKDKRRDPRLDRK